MLKSWWERLTRGAQKKYISEHPESIYAKRVKAAPSGSVQRSDESNKMQAQIYRNKLLHLHQRYRRMVAKGASKEKLARLMIKMTAVKTQLSKAH
jgi:hypothetical protein